MPSRTTSNWRSSSSSWARSKGQLKDDNVQFDPALDRRGPIGLISVAAIKVENPDQPTEDKKKPQQPSVAGEKSGKKSEEISRWGKVIVIGDSNFASNTHIKLAGNRDLFLNAINWLAAEVALISVRSKEPGLSPLTLTSSEGRLVFWLSVIIMPSLFLVIGAGVLLRRKSEA